MHVAQPVQRAADLKDKTCFNCGKKGHLAENCPELKKCSHCGKKGHLAKDCWEKHPDKKPKLKPKSQSSNSKGKGGNDKRGQSGGRGRGKGGIMTIKLTKLWGATHKHSCKCYATRGSTYR